MHPQAHGNGGPTGGQPRENVPKVRSGDAAQWLGLRFGPGAVKWPGVCRADRSATDPR